MINGFPPFNLKLIHPCTTFLSLECSRNARHVINFAKGSHCYASQDLKYVLYLGAE